MLKSSGFRLPSSSAIHHRGQREDCGMYSRTSGLHAPWRIPSSIGVCAVCDRTELWLRTAPIPALRWTYRSHHVSITPFASSVSRARLSVPDGRWTYAHAMATTDRTPGAAGEESGRVPLGARRRFDFRRHRAAGRPRARRRHRRRSHHTGGWGAAQPAGQTQRRQGRGRGGHRRRGEQPVVALRDARRRRADHDRHRARAPADRQSKRSPTAASARRGPG